MAVTVVYTGVDSVVSEMAIDDLLMVEDTVTSGVSVAMGIDSLTEMISEDDVTSCESSVVETVEDVIDGSGSCTDIDDVAAVYIACSAYYA